MSTPTTAWPALRVATWNIHKGVQGHGPAKRLEIHNIGHGIEQFDADLICLQEVRLHHRRLERTLARWPLQGQADYLAPEGYEAVYRSNAVTRHGEHGNALLSRWPVLACQHVDMSDHRFEQRGLLHVTVQVAGRPLQVLVVHLGLVPASRERQITQLLAYIAREIGPEAPLVLAGDFNDWGSRIPRRLVRAGLVSACAERLPTYPARLPLAQLDHVFVRGMHPRHAQVPHGRIWRRMSDHLPLLADLAPAG